MTETADKPSAAPASPAPAASAAGSAPAKGKGPKPEKAEANPYKDSLLLPKTDYPMKAGLDQLEPRLQAEWNRQDMYARIRTARAGRPKSVLHDGPPYATGDLHVGTGLNKVLKDFVVRYKTMRGYDSPFRPGWDCHGLPIESRVMKELGPKARSTPTPELRKRCFDYAMKFFARNREEFCRLGIFGEWQRPYLTTDFDYEAGILDVFADMVEKGYVYRALRPIHWCLEDETALAEAELEYGPEVSPSVTVRFPFAGSVADLFPAAGDAAADLLIWTTTPWTLPANVAIAVHPDHEYALVRYADAGGAVRHVLLAEALVEPNFARAGITGWEKLGTVKGKKLEGRKYRHVFLDREGVVVTADYVTVGGEGRGIDESQIVNKDDDAGASDAASGAGTGLVHTAPGHGREDFLTGRKYGLPVLSPVDAGGRLTDAAGVFVGDKVFDADPKIVAMLRDKGVLFHHEPYKHQYPHCWRCKKPVIFRATDQWFVNVDHEDLRGRMAEQIAGHVRWFPEAGKNRIGGMVKQRPDWCISRQRHWGVAIPAFFNRKTGEGLIRADVVRHVRDLFARHGSGYWFEHTAKELLPPGFTHEGFTADDFEKDHAIFDVWFESGASHRAVLRNDPAEQFPADTYLEGSDQHRGWFQVSLITAMAADGVPPFRNVVTHGFVVDDKGEKMSKSAGNYISLGDALKFAGADLFRLWVSSIDYSKEINTSQELMKRVHDPYRTFRNTLRILFGNLAGFDPAKDRVPTERLTPIDRWAVSQLQGLVRECLAAYDGYQFFKVFSAVHQFCGVTLSSFYVDVLKDRMYCDPAKGEARRSSQTAMYDILSALIRLMAPVLVHTAEEAWTHFRALGGAEGPDALPDSVHLALLPEPDAALADPAGDARWERLLKVRGDANREIEKLRKDGKIGKSLEAAVTLHTTDPELKALLVGFGPTELGTVLMVSSVTLSDSAGEGFVAAADTPGLSVKAVPASGPKCVRCWNIRSDVGSVAKHPTLCKRCADVVG